MKGPIEWMRDEEARLDASQAEKYQRAERSGMWTRQTLMDESRREWAERNALREAITLYQDAHPSPPPPPVAGSPIEPGDRIELDEDGRAHASPRRHAYGYGYGGDSGYCRVCGQGKAYADEFEEHECPGPPRSTQGVLSGPMGGG